MKQTQDCGGNALLRRLLCVSYNAGGCYSSIESLHAFIDSVSWSYPSWSVIYLTEADNKLRHLEEFNYFNIDGHETMRHWPGHGSFAMMFIVHRSFVPILKDVEWQGRAGSVHLYSTCNSILRNVNIVIAGVHGGHGDKLQKSLMHAGTIIRSFVRHSSSLAQVAFVGDFNVHVLPILLCGLCTNSPSLSLHHYERRRAL